MEEWRKKGGKEERKRGGDPFISTMTGSEGSCPVPGGGGAASQSGSSGTTAAVICRSAGMTDPGQVAWSPTMYQ